MFSSAGAYPLALYNYTDKKPSDDRPRCLENPRPEGAESTLTENAASPFPAEPKHRAGSSTPQGLHFVKSLLRSGGQFGGGGWRMKAATDFAALTARGAKHSYGFTDGREPAAVESVRGRPHVESPRLILLSAAVLEC
jgi:hypothetical protein